MAMEATRSWAQTALNLVRVTPKPGRVVPRATAGAGSSCVGRASGLVEWRLGAAGPLGRRHRGAEATRQRVPPQCPLSSLSRRGLQGQRLLGDLLLELTVLGCPLRSGLTIQLLLGVHLPLANRRANVPAETRRISPAQPTPSQSAEPPLLGLSHQYEDSS